MHIVILASTPEIAARIQATLEDAADRCTIATTWADFAAFSKENRPDLILIERTVLARVELSTLSSLAELDRWPPLLFVDGADARTAVGIVQRFARAAPAYYQIGDLHIDTRKRRAKVEENWVTLPPIQYRLLLALAQRADEVIGSQELLRLVWGYEAGEIEARELVKVHIRQIRRRLGLDSEKHHYIHSVRGFGYMLTPPEED